MGFFLPCRLCFGGVFVPGPREGIEAFWNAFWAAAVATGLTGSTTSLTGVTGLTGAGHRSDRCSTGSKPCNFPLCVACWCVLARKDVCWFLGLVALQWLRGLGQLG
jgi:hypothetical protein